MVLHPTWGFDVAAPLTTRMLPMLHAWGGGFIGGYLWEGGKGMTAESVDVASRAGLSILSYYEAQGDQPTSFSLIRGTIDANDACNLAALIGQPRSSSIFFCVDFDASEEQVRDLIVPYFEGVHAGMEGRYGVAAYGSGAVLHALADQQLIEGSVLSCSRGWRGYDDFLTSATVVQSVPSDPYGFGFEVDSLRAQRGLCGLAWSGPAFAADAGPATVGPLQRGDGGDAVRVVQRLLGVPEDGWWGPQTEVAAVMYRSRLGLPPGAALSLVLTGG